MNDRGIFIFILRKEKIIFLSSQGQDYYPVCPVIGRAGQLTFIIATDTLFSDILKLFFFLN